MTGQKRETDAVKLMTVRAGMLDLSQSWEAMGRKCHLLAQSQKVSNVMMPVSLTWEECKGANS